MKGNSITHTEAIEILSKEAVVTGTERVLLAESFNRVLAQEVRAIDNVPPFDRSPLDGYAFRSCDVKDADRDNPVTLKVIDYIPAGDVSHVPVTEGCAVRLMTGAPVPEGADCVTMYEVTEFTDEEVKIFSPSKPGDNIVRAGEDVKKGELLASCGVRIDAGLAATLAAQNISEPVCFRQLKIGIISTGSELVPVGTELTPGKIHDTNQYSIGGAVENLGFKTIRYGIVADTADEIAAALTKALSECDAVITTGGVSAGDYDVTPDAMEKAGVNVLFRGVKLKPGMACAFGTCKDKMVCALSGNPSSSLITFYVVAAPILRKMSGLKDYENREIMLTLAEDFTKKSKATRVLKGRLDLSDGTARIRFPEGQGNVMISSTIGCDCAALIPAGSGPVKAGTVLKGFLI